MNIENPRNLKLKIRKFNCAGGESTRRASLPGERAHRLRGAEAQGDIRPTASG